MYHLPKDIVQYIYSFDDNIIVKKNKKHSLIELKSKFNYKICMSEILIGTSVYNIYLPDYLVKKQIMKIRRIMTINRCLLQRNKNFKRIKNSNKKITNFVIKYIPKASIIEVKRNINYIICMSDLLFASSIYNDIYYPYYLAKKRNKTIYQWVLSRNMELKKDLKKGDTLINKWVLGYPIDGVFIVCNH